MFLVNNQEAVLQSNPAADNRITLVILISQGFDTGSWELTVLLNTNKASSIAGLREQLSEPQQRPGLLREPRHSQEPRHSGSCHHDHIPCHLSGCLPAQLLQSQVHKCILLGAQVISGL